MITVRIELIETSQPIVRSDVINTYTKGLMYCVYRKAAFVEKYPIANIWRVTEDYS